MAKNLIEYFSLMRQGGGKNRPGGRPQVFPVLLLAAMAALFPVGGRLEAEDHADLAQSQTVVKKKDGLRFNVPSDWPVEERNGAVGPIPVEEYLAKKFASLESRLRVIEQQVNSFDLRLRILEEQVKRGARAGGALRSGEQTASSQ